MVSPFRVNGDEETPKEGYKIVTSRMEERDKRRKGWTEECVRNLKQHDWGNRRVSEERRRYSNLTKWL